MVRSSVSSALGALAILLPGQGGGQAKPAPQPSAWILNPKPALQIGSPDASDTVYQLSRVIGAVRLTDGRIVVVDGVDARWFDSAGRYLYTTSRSGGGPGEFRFAAAILRMPSDTVLVEGGRPIKHLFFAPTGKLVREEHLDEPKFARLRQWAECESLLLPDRSKISCAYLPGEYPQRPDPGPGHLRQFHSLYRVTWPLDSVVPLGREAGIEQHGLNLGGRQTTFVIHPFYARSFKAAGGNPLRIVTAPNPEYAIEIWRPDGVLERTITRPQARGAPTAAERAAVPGIIARFLPPGVTADRVLSQMPVPRLLPAVVGLAVAPGGEILVMREGWLPTQGSSPVDVFDRSGRLITTIRLPPRFRIFEVGVDYILGRRLTEDDVQVVELYRMKRQ